MWWYTPLTQPSGGWGRTEAGFEVSLGYRARPCVKTQTKPEEKQTLLKCKCWRWPSPGPGLFESFLARYVGRGTNREPTKRLGAVLPWKASSCLWALGNLAWRHQAAFYTQREQLAFTRSSRTQFLPSVMCMDGGPPTLPPFLFSEKKGPWTTTPILSGRSSLMAGSTCVQLGCCLPGWGCHCIFPWRKCGPRQVYCYNLQSS